MIYYHIHVYTPFCGEEADVYIAAEDEAQYQSKAHNAAMENGMEWYDEEEWLECQGYDKDSDDYDEVCDEYYAQCGIQYRDRITEDAYKYYEAQGEWCI